MQRNNGDMIIESSTVLKAQPRQVFPIYKTGSEAVFFMCCLCVLCLLLPVLCSMIVAFTGHARLFLW